MIVPSVPQEIEKKRNKLAETDNSDKCFIASINREDEYTHRSKPVDTLIQLAR